MSLRVWRFLTVTYVAAVLAVTSFPVERGPDFDDLNFIPLGHHGPALRCVLRWCGTARTALWYLFVDGVGNVALFVPVGFCLRMVLRGRPLAVWLIALGVSVGIESLQLAIPGRTTDIDDVILNGLGAAAGVFAASRWRRIANV